MNIFHRKKDLIPQAEEILTESENIQQDDKAQTDSEKTADTMEQLSQNNIPENSESENIDGENIDDETTVSDQNHNEPSECENDSSEMLTAFNKRMDTFEELLTTSQDHCAEHVKHIEEKMQWLSGQYEKLSKMYDLMTEYKKQSSLATLKLADMYERLELLKIFTESTFDNESEQNILLRKKIAATQSFLHKTLISFGIVPIFPSRNDELNEQEHEIITIVDPESETDLPGHIAECVKMGIQKDNVVVKAAEVTVFRKNKE